MKCTLHNLGCKVNSYETEKMKTQFETVGYEIVSFSEKADVYVVNTCTVTNIADRKSRKMLHRARRMNPDAVVVAAGCYVDSARQKGEEDESVDLFIGNEDKETMISKGDFKPGKLSRSFCGRNVGKGRTGAAYQSIY